MKKKNLTISNINSELLEKNMMLKTDLEWIVYGDEEGEEENDVPEVVQEKMQEGI